MSEQESSQVANVQVEFSAGNRHPFILGLIVTSVISFVWIGVYLSSKTVDPYFVVIGYFLLAFIASPLEFYYLQSRYHIASSGFRVYLLGCTDTVAIAGAFLILILFFNFSI